ncbi:unnamed protein product [Cuscuta epithymum]|uniref:Uncharacterized protein n=1 Tax=Cuscuta epithymum TaxID=186058 RepID=A0AAV0FFY1_9ASTE|nr:unnamed protein product [Cuscuta epithymum]
MYRSLRRRPGLAEQGSDFSCVSFPFLFKIFIRKRDCFFFFIFRFFFCGGVNEDSQNGKNKQALAGAVNHPPSASSPSSSSSLLLHNFSLPAAARPVTSHRKRMCGGGEKCIFSGGVKENNGKGGGGEGLRRECPSHSLLDYVSLGAQPLPSSYLSLHQQEVDFFKEDMRNGHVELEKYVITKSLTKPLA